MFIGKMRELFGGSGKSAAREPVIQVDHAGEVESYDRESLNAVLQGFVQKQGAMMDIERLAVNVKKHNATAKKHKYSIHAALYTADGVFRSEKVGWDVVTAASMSLDELKKQALKRKHKAADVKRSTRRLQK